ncbi:ABC transporter substrate-binding protein [Candidatus Poriferisocius sp.]|uniref:ABC transporter substrate-binding protein n=1 Tax=Candidatus Poriferisocius sp. TaxID=3101276 RepID=UPI003B5B4654
MRSRWLRLLAALLALAVFAVSCGNDDDDGAVVAGGPDPTAAPEAPADDPEPSGSEPSDPEEEAPAEEPAPEPTEEVQVTQEEAEEVEGVVPTGNTGFIDGSILSTECTDGRPTGGTLTMGMFGEITGWDPTLIQGGASLGATQMHALYDALLYLDLKTGQLIPGLAEGITTEDNQEFVLTLREGVNFTDGTPVNADAFIWNVEHHQNPNAGSQSAQQANLIASMEKIDDLTIRLTATSPNAVFPQIFTNRMAWLMSPTAYEDGRDPETGLNSDININPIGVGAGPFVFDSWVQDDQAVLVRNPDYFREGCPYLDSVIFKPIIDPTQRYNAFNAGDLDIAFDRFPQNIVDAKERGVNTATRIDNHGGYWMLNNQKEPFNVRACRAAVSYAIDYDTVNEVVWDGINIMNRSLMRPGSPWTDPAPEAQLPGYDPDAAAAALQECEAELGGPLDFETFCTTSPENVLLTETFVAMWDAVGISATAKCVEVGEMVTAVFTGEAVANPWAVPVGDPDYMYDMYYGDSPEDGVCGEGISSRNWPKVCHPELDEALTAGRQGLTFEDRYEAYSRFQRKFAQEVPLILTTKTEVGYYWIDEVSGVFQTETGALLLGFTAKG